MKRLDVMLCCGVIALGLVVALYSDALRVRADEAYRDVLVLVDWQGFASLTAPFMQEAANGVKQPQAATAAAQGQPAAASAIAARPRMSAAEQRVSHDATSTQLPPRAIAKTTADEISALSAAGSSAVERVSPKSQPSHAALLSAAHWRLLGELPGAMLCYGEETIGSLSTQGILIPARQRTISPAYEVAVERYADDIYHGAIRHGYLVERGWYTGGKLVITLPSLGAEELSQLPVCWLSEVRQAAREHGVQVVLRPSGGEFLGPQGIARTFEFAKGQPLMLFQGPQVLGNPAQLGVTASELKQAKMRFGWVEFDEQDGGAELAARVSPYIIRVHSIPPEEMQNYSVDGAVARLMRAVRERNIRCLYLRPFVQGSVIADTGSQGYRDQLLEVNQKYFAAVRDGMKQYGFRTAADAPQPTDVPEWLNGLRRITVALAAGAAAILLMLLWFPAWPRWAWWTLRIVNVLVAVGAIRLNMLYTPALLLCALAFPLLGFWLALWLYQRVVQDDAPWSPRRLLLALAALLVASVSSALGGLLIHGGMWDAATMLKVGQFRGVTPALAIPIVLFAAYAWQAESLQAAFDRASLRLMPYWQRFMALWTAPIRYGDVAFIMIALGAIGIVLLRSGNDSPLEVLSVESWFRGNLEHVFSVRPRTKELLGHPLLVVFLLSLVWRNRLALLFGLAALLGQVSILNTFCHLHTPLLLTAQRVALGIGLGLINGAIWGALLLLGNWVWEKLRGKSTAAA